MLDHGSHSCLLQHDLGNPNPIRIAILAPRQVARMRVVPSKQAFTKPVRAQIFLSLSL